MALAYLPTKDNFSPVNISREQQEAARKLLPTAKYSTEKWVDSKPVYGEMTEMPKGWEISMTQRIGDRAPQIRYSEGGLPIISDPKAEKASREKENRIINRDIQRQENMEKEAFNRSVAADSKKYGFSEDFLSHIRQARVLNRQQRAADVEKTGAETGLAGAQADLASAQTGRISTLTPFEAQNMAAQSGLYGAQAGKYQAETLSEYGKTPMSQANMYAAYAGAEAGLMGGRARLTEAGGSTTTKSEGPFGETITTTPVGGYFGGGGGGGAPTGGYFGGGGGGGGGGAPMGGYFGGGGGGGGSTSGASITPRAPYVSAFPTTQQPSYIGAKGLTITPRDRSSTQGYIGAKGLTIRPSGKPNMGLGGPTYTGNFGGYRGYPATGNYNQRSGKG